MHRERVSETAYKWWLALWISGLFMPRMPLPFMPGKSALSLAVPVGLLYVLWRLTRHDLGVPAPVRFPILIAHLIAAYFLLHAVYCGLFAGRATMLMELQWVFFFVVSFFLVYDMRGLNDFKGRVTRSLVTLLFCEAVIAIPTAVLGPVYPQFVGAHGLRWFASYRAVGTLSSANSLAGLMAFGAVLALYAPRKELPANRALLAAVLIAALLLSQSKSGYGSIYAAVLVCTLLALAKLIALPERFSPRKMLSLVTACLILVALGVAVLNVNAVFLLEEDLAIRLQLTRGVQYSFETADLLTKSFGVGFRQTAQFNTTTGAWLTAHNSYIALLAEIGIIGLVLLSAILLAELAFFYKAGAMHWFAGVVIVIVHSTSECFLYAFLYVMLVGAMLPTAWLYYNESLREAERRTVPIGYQASPRPPTSITAADGEQ